MNISGFVVSFLCLMSRGAKRENAEKDCRNCGHQSGPDGEWSLKKSLYIIVCSQVKTFGHGMSVSVVKPKQTLGMAEDPSFAFCELQVTKNRAQKCYLLSTRFYFYFLGPGWSVHYGSEPD